MSDDLTTKDSRPMPQRPRLGWIAWEATVGYIATQHSPDAMLKLQIYPMTEQIRWAASLTWGQNAESVREASSLPRVLKALWTKVEQDHEIFHTLEAATKRPAMYMDNRWIDASTQEIIDRLVDITHKSFENDWLIMVIYRPVENADERLQARLLAANNTVHRSGRGSSLRDAFRDLYHNAVPNFNVNTNN